MALKSRFFQANFFAAILRSATLAIVLLMSASPASAEVVTLICQNETGGNTFTLRVDYDRKIVDMPNSADMSEPVGTALFSAPATITESDVSWNLVMENMNGYKFMGGISRLSGIGFVLFPTKYSNNAMGENHFAGPCRRATQKF